MILRFFVLLISCLPVFSKCFAQYFEGGVLAGITASQIDGDMLGGYHKPGITTGVWVGREINPRWHYRAELKYTMKGASSNRPTEQYTIFRKTLHYIELPLLLSYNFWTNLYAEAGPSAAYLAHASVYIDNQTADATGSMKRHEFNALLGIGYQLNRNFLINFRFSYSLFPISYLPGHYTIWNTYAQYNNVLSLSVYYKVK